MGIRQLAKRNRLLFWLNSRRRAWQLERRAAQLSARYETEARALGMAYSEQWARDTVRQRLASRGILGGHISSRDVRIFWIGTDLNQDGSGLLQALRRRGIVEVCESGGRYGLALPPPSNGVTDPAVVRQNSESLASQLDQAYSRAPVHLLLGQMWANFLSEDVLRRAQDRGTIVVNIALDDRLPELWRSSGGRRMGPIGLAGGVDLTLTTSRDCLIRYRVHDSPAFYWPMASDPQFFLSAGEEAKEFDIAFVGTRYGFREELVKALRSAGLRVTVFGPGWPAGALSAQDAASLFARSRIILGVGTVGHSRRIFTLKLRDFDAPMAGALYLTHRNPDLLSLFREGDEIECYDSVGECIEKARYYLSHPAERIRIGEAAARTARERHTWDQRFEQLFDILQMGRSAPPNLQCTPKWEQ